MQLPGEDGIPTKAVSVFFQKLLDLFSMFHLILVLVLVILAPVNEPETQTVL